MPGGGHAGPDGRASDTRAAAPVALPVTPDPVVTDGWSLLAPDPWRGVHVEVRAALAELPEKG